MRLMSTIATLCAILAAGCGPIDAFKEGMAQSEAVSVDLEKSLGSKPFVGFNWNNGTLNSVNVTFQGIPSGHPLPNILERSKESVVRQFKQEPKQIVVAFAVAL